MRAVLKSMVEFDKYMAVDWSGARGKSHPGIALAACKGEGASPFLMLPKGANWSRQDVADVILHLAAKQERTLVGFDFSFAPPFYDKGAYFPECREIPESPMDFWWFTERATSPDADFYAGRLPEYSHLKDYFHQRGHRGKKYERRLRQTEKACIDQGWGRAESIFHLIGPTQVGMASFAGMRMLSYLKKQNPAIAIWPFENPSEKEVTLVEIYSRLFLAQAGFARQKVRDWQTVDQGIREFGSASVTEETRNIKATDHRTDAIISVAGLRHLAQQEKNWLPGGSYKEAASSEGWTFGVV